MYADYKHRRVRLTSNSWPCGSGASVTYLEGVSMVGVVGDFIGVE